MISYTVIGALYIWSMGQRGMRSHLIRKRVMGRWVASWLSSSGECMTKLRGPMHRIGENVGWEKSKMSLYGGDGF
jgi:hypothetical protein